MERAHTRSGKRHYTIGRHRWGLIEMVMADTSMARKRRSCIPVIRFAAVGPERLVAGKTVYCVLSDENVFVL